MFIRPINNTTFTGIKVYPQQNKDVKFLYNKLLDTVQQQKLPATFKTDVVELPSNNKLKDILAKFGIKFQEDK